MEKAGGICSVNLSSKPVKVMFYHFIYPLSKYFFVFNVVHYITFRASCAFVMSFLVVVIFWNKTLKSLNSLKLIERIDMYGHISLEALHKGKKGTPTMGGVLIIFSILISTFLWARWDNQFIWYAISVVLSLGLVGLRDDFLKIKTGKGIKRSEKLFFQILIGCSLGIVLFVDKGFSVGITIPFVKKVIWNLGYFYILWVALVVVSTSNAVNFTDGLDGLAIGAVIVTCLVFALVSYVVGNIKFAHYLFLPYVSGVGELSVLCASMVGAGLGFLWFNAYPAQIFMGDVGALSLGGAIGAVAICIKQEFLLIIAGGIFVLEAISVLMQIISVKLIKKKIFKAAPLHHHLQLLGWPESKIVIRMWIASIIFAVFALMSLKLR